MFGFKLGNLERWCVHEHQPFGRSAFLTQLHVASVGTAHSMPHSRPEDTTWNRETRRASGRRRERRKCERERPGEPGSDLNMKERERERQRERERAREREGERGRGRTGGRRRYSRKRLSDRERKRERDLRAECMNLLVSLLKGSGQLKLTAYYSIRSRTKQQKAEPTIQAAHVQTQ